jgi:hypothetical protein
MRELTTTLLAAQKSATATPYVKLAVTNRIAGAVRYDWERLYTGGEDEYFHDLTIPGDGSLIRVRITPPSDSQKLYRQRVASPGPGSDFSQWTYTGQYNAVAVAAASLGTEVSIFWIKTNREIRRLKSTDNGVNWGSAELIDYTPTTSMGGMAAAYKPNGDLAIFYADQSTLYVKRNISGEWQSTAGWDKSTGDITGVDCVYNGDWNLLLTGQDSAGNYRLWSLIYGDGGDVPAGEWPDLIEIASAPAGEDFEFRQPFLDKTDTYRCFFIEKFTGDKAYSRPYQSHTVAETEFIDGLWREPVPFNLTSEYGLAIAHHEDYAWLTTPDGVWMAASALMSLELTADIISVKAENALNSGRLTVELRNDDGRYAAPGEGDLEVLDIGGQVEISPGYLTAAGNEYSDGPVFQMEGYEHTSSGGKADLVLRAEDGWQALGNWKARYQFRWNKTSDELNVKEMIEIILGRVGIRLEVITESETITGFYPDITINAGSEGRSTIRKLLSYVPDVIFIEGHKAYLVNPLPSDTAVYDYGTDHVILAGRYGCRAQGINSVQVEGYDTGSQEMVLAGSFDWDEIARSYERPEQIEDRNIGSVTEAGERGQAVLRGAGIDAEDGQIIVPTNCGQQLTDVIEVTDSRAGLAAAKKRITGITMDYRPQQGEYSQRLRLGAV